MLVIGVDPGPEETAWVVLEESPIVAGGPLRIRAFAKESNEPFIHRLRGCGPFEGRVFTFADKHYPISHMAIEMIASYGMAVGATTFDTCVFIGRCIEAWGGEYTKVFRKKVALHVCQSPRANDANVRAAMIDKFGAPGTKKNQGGTYGIAGDVWSALAIATTYLEGGV